MAWARCRVGPRCPQSPLSRGAVRGKGAGATPVMALLLEHEFKPLPADKQIETLPFLEAVAHLPPFFGETRGCRGLEMRGWEHRPAEGSSRSGLPLPPVVGGDPPFPSLYLIQSSRRAWLLCSVASRSCQTRRAALPSLEHPVQRHGPGQELPSHPRDTGGCRRGTMCPLPSTMSAIVWQPRKGRTSSGRGRSGYSRTFYQGCVPEPGGLEVPSGAAVGGRAVPRANSHVQSSEIRSFSTFAGLSQCPGCA